MSRDSERFLTAVLALHREKDAAYGSSWKRRGELISIMSNMARKVDRLELAKEGASGTRDENAVDTAVDLFVYSIKYKTYLADQDPDLDGRLFGRAPGAGARSDGPRGFEQLVRSMHPTLDEAGSARSADEAIDEVVAAFTELERCFANTQIAAPVAKRSERVDAVATAAWRLLGALRHQSPEAFASFLNKWSGSSDR